MSRLRTQRGQDVDVGSIIYLRLPKHTSMKCLKYTQFLYSRTGLEVAHMPRELNNLLITARHASVCMMPAMRRPCKEIE